jgi:spermidine synthase
MYQRFYVKMRGTYQNLAMTDQMETEQNNNTLNAAIISSFWVLGFNALIFQVVFGKKLMMLFGMTAPAVSTILAVYFSGMALGSFLLGKAADRIKPGNIYKLYTCFFVLTGLYGFLFPQAFKLLNWLILLVNEVYRLDFSGFNFFAVLFSFIFLILPAIFLGGGLAVTGKLYIHKEGEVGRNISLLYFVNTFGAMSGAALTGFLFVPYLGFNETLFLASSLSLITAALLYLKFKGGGFFHANHILNEEPKGSEEKERRNGIKNPVFLYALFFTGFLALALEVLYTKTLILFIGSSTYAFSLILVVFLSGIALGSLVTSLITDRFKINYAFFGMLLGVLGFWLFITIYTFDDTSFWYLKLFRVFKSYDFITVTFTQFLITGFFVFPPAFLMGLILPLGIKLATPDLSRLGEGVGKLYFANTFGGVIGSFIAGFIFLQQFGYQKTLIIIAISYCILGGFFILKEKNIGRLTKVIFILFPLSFGVSSIMTHSWSQSVMTSGIFKKIHYYLSVPDEKLKQLVMNKDILFYNEGLSNIAVTKQDGYLLLRVNGKTDASTFLSDLETEILIGTLPMALHPDPEDVLVVGLGAGISLGAITQFDEAENIDMVEIDPVIIKAAEYFSEHNNDALKDPRVNIIQADARNHLYLTDRKYDVISLEPSNIWVSGNVNLFTKEFYELARSRMEDDGIILQWLHIYALEKEDVKSILKTFQQTFSQTIVFDTITAGDIFIVGSIKKEPILDFDVISQKFNNKKVKDELSRIFIRNPYELVSYLALDGERLKEYIKGAELHTDNRTFIEFSASRAMYRNQLSKLLEEISLLKDKIRLSETVTGGDKKELERHFAFSKKLMLYKIAFREPDYPKAIDMYLNAKKLGFTRDIAEINLLTVCESSVENALKENNQQKAKAIYDKCNQLFGE